jgi:hydroxyacylglutathione hydrolase
MSALKYPACCLRYLRGITEMEIFQLPMLQDNYSFILCDRTQNIAAVIDPAEANPILDCLKALNLNLVAIFNTHHHHDHIGGNRELLQQFPAAVVYGGAEDRGRIPGQQVFLHGGERLTFARRDIQVLFIPGHTKAHIAYYWLPNASVLAADAPAVSAFKAISSPESPPVWGRLPKQGDGFTETWIERSPHPFSCDPQVGELFCGDTIFGAGCGRLREGTAAQMVESLGRLRSLPETTRIWCAHEYTLNNLKFALTVDGKNPELRARYERVEKRRGRSQATVPLSLAEENRTNPFLNWDSPAIQQYLNQTDPVQAFARLRELKELF